MADSQTAPTAVAPVDTAVRRGTGISDILASRWDAILRLGLLGIIVVLAIFFTVRTANSPLQLGTSTFLIGAVASPLVGIGGEHTAVPLAVVQLAAALVAAECFMGMCRPWEPRNPEEES